MMSFVESVERIGFHHLDVLDHAAQDVRPSLDALTTLSFAAGKTQTIGLGATSVMLAESDVSLVAEQANTINMLSGGRLRLCVCLEEQTEDRSPLGRSHDHRGERVGEAIGLLRSHLSGETQDLESPYYQADDLRMTGNEASIPIWVEGVDPHALTITGRYADGWSGGAAKGLTHLKMILDTIRQHAVEAGRDPKRIDFQLPLAPFASEPQENFLNDSEGVLARVFELEALGINWLSLDTASLCPEESPTADRLAGRLEALFEVLKPKL